MSGNAVKKSESFSEICGDTTPFNFESLQIRFEKQVDSHPNSVAVKFENKTLTYLELDKKANQVANYLRSNGVRRDSFVGLFLDRSIEMVVAILGVVKAGGAYVPIDLENPEDRLHFLISDISPEIIITQARYRARIGSNFKAKLFSVDSYVENLSDNRVQAINHPSDVFYMIYTSGSTGKPKGCQVTHQGISNCVNWQTEKFTIAKNEKMLFKTPYTFDVSVPEIFWPLTSGGQLVIAKPEGHKDPGYLARLIKDNSITHAQFVPSMLQIFLEEDSTQCSTLQLVTVAGEALSTQTVKQFFKGLPNARLINLYGPTETAGVGCTYWECSPADEIIPIGHPIPNNQIYILDENQQPVEQGKFGELYVGGAQVARGYWNQPKLTEERFIKNIFASNTNQKMYKTGDVARINKTGALEFKGRKDSQIKLRGMRVELGEIEAILLEHNSLLQVAVVAKNQSNEILGKTLVAYCLPKAGQVFDPDLIRKFATQKLPEFMVPSAFICLDKLPLLSSGKIDRNTLVARQDVILTASDYLAPTTDREKIFCSVVEQVLGISRIGTSDNFFRLGGNSLSLMRVIQRLKKNRIQIEFADFYGDISFGELAKLSEKSESEKSESEKSKKGTVEIPQNKIPKYCEKITPELLVLANVSQNEIDKIAASVPGGHENIQDIYPLGPLQQGLLYHHILSPKNDPYLLSFMYKFDSKNSLDQFTNAYQKVVDRHDILRTMFFWEDLREPLQIVCRKVEVFIREIDLNSSEENIANQLRKHVERNYTNIDVRKPPLIRMLVAKDISTKCWYLSLVCHHLLADHESFNIIAEEIREIIAGRSTSLPAVIPYRNFVAKTMHAPLNESHADFFRKMLSDIDESTAPLGLFETQTDLTLKSEGSFEVDNFLSSRIRKMSRELGVSPAAVFHLAFAQVLSAFTGQEKVVFGTVLFAPAEDENNEGHGIGLFINTLPVKIVVDSEGVVEKIREIHTLLAQLMDHQFASLAVAQKSSNIDGASPLFTSILNYRYMEKDADGSANKRLHIGSGIEEIYDKEHTTYPLDVSIDDRGNGFRIVIDSHSLILPSRVSDFIQKALSELAKSIEKAAQQSVQDLDVLPTYEKEKILMDFAGDDENLGSYRSVHELFVKQAEKSPDQVALKFKDQAMTYRDLDEKSNQLAFYLRQRQIKRNEFVAISMDRSIGMVVAILGVLKAGAAYVPVDPELPEERLKFILDDIEPALILKEPVPSLDDLPTTNVSDLTESDDAAYMIYTSGSTGVPKGCINTHKGLLNKLLWTQKKYELNSRSTILFRSSFTFDTAIAEIFRGLISGARVVITESSLNRDIQYIIDVIIRDSVSDIEITPSFLDVFLDESRATKCTSLQRVIAGGETLTKATVEKFYSVLPSAKLTNSYGPSEAAIDICYSDTSLDKGYDLIPIGRPISNNRIYVLDRRTQLVPLGVFGEIHIGGIQVAKGYWHRPELTAEKFIADSFKGGSSKIYRTGDIGRFLPNGEIEFKGRNDLQVKVRGFRVELGEIEAKLLKHRMVKQVAVVAVKNGDVSQIQSIVAYFVANKDFDQENQAKDLKSYLEKELPEYMVPSFLLKLDYLPLLSSGKVDRKALSARPITFATSVESDAVELSSTEKSVMEHFQKIVGLKNISIKNSFLGLGGNSLQAIRLTSAINKEFGLRLNLKVLFESRSLGELSKNIDQALGKNSAGSPINLTEQTVIRHIEKILGLENIGIENSFLGLGGNSLQAIRLTSAINKEFGLRLNLKVLFESKSLRELCKNIDIAIGKNSVISLDKAPEAVVNQNTSIVRCSFIQECWIKYFGAAESSAGYNILVAYKLDGLINLKKFEASVEDVVGRHEALRTKIEKLDLKYVQRIESSRSGYFNLKSAEAFRNNDREETQKKLINEVIEREVPLNDQALFACNLWQLNDAEAFLVITANHLVADGASLLIIGRDLANFYNSRCSGRAADLPNLKLQYSDFSYLEGEKFKEIDISDDYEKLRVLCDGISDKLVLSSHTVRTTESRRGGSSRIVIGSPLVSRLQNFARKHNTTLNVICLSALNVVISRITKQPNILVMVVTSTRSNADLDDVVGLFLDYDVIRTKVESEVDFLKLTKEVQNSLLDSLSKKSFSIFAILAHYLVNGKLFDGFFPQFYYNFIDMESSDLKLEGLKVEPVSIPHQNEIVSGNIDDYFIEWSKNKDSYNCDLRYGCGTIGSAEARDFLQIYLKFLETIASEE